MAAEHAPQWSSASDWSATRAKYGNRETVRSAAEGVADRTHGACGMAAQVSYDDIVAARELLDDVIVRTPMPHSCVLSELVGGPVHLKCENLLSRLPGGIQALDFATPTWG